jgi:hypothetical protein
VVMAITGTKGLERKVAFTAVVGLAAAAVIGAGLFYFRWFHGLPNLYQPTIDYLRDGVAADLLKSPNLEWLTHFTWLFVTPLVVAMALLTTLRGSNRLDRTEIAAVAMAAGQWIVHWLDQFVRDGSGLEISYYWSMSFCTLGIAIALVVARLASTITPAQTAALLTGWVGFFIVGLADWLRLPSGLEFGAISILVVGVLAALVRRFVLSSTAVFLTYMLWIQVGAPVYDPSAYHSYNVSPRYDELFWSDGESSEAGYREALWFAEEMDQIEDDDQALFLPTGAWASPIVGIYHAHVGERVVGFDDSGQLYREQRFALMSNELPWLAVYGPPDLVQDQLDTTIADLGLGPSVLDVTHATDKGYRLVVFPLPKTPPLPLVMEAGELPTLVGVVDGDDVVSSEAGFATYGPYVALAPGRYSVTIEYRSDAPSTQTIGTIDVYSGKSDVIADAPLPGTGGRPAEVQLPFEVTSEGDSWEFRTTTTGEYEVVVDRIILDQRQ